MRIQLKDGTYEWIDSYSKFRDLIAKYLGDDANKYLDEVHGDISDVVCEVKEFLDDEGMPILAKDLDKATDILDSIS